jgi:hypothetical protein
MNRLLNLYLISEEFSRWGEKQNKWKNIPEKILMELIKLLI